jgi:Animal haem peroxidase
LSDMFGRIDILEDKFDDILRGSMNQKLNDAQYTDEMYNKFAKNKNGVGVDVLSIDIQRGKV